MVEPICVDFLVIGSGIAGLWFALRAGRRGSVLVITKKQDTESNTNYAQGGIAAAEAENDSPRLHREDTEAVGAGLAHPDVVELVTEAGPALVRELFEAGVRFTTYRDSHGQLRFDLGREGGHHRRRIVHAQDFTGFEIERGLLGAVRASGSIGLSEHHYAFELLKDGTGRCSGVRVLDTETGTEEVVRAGVTLLATGGIGQAYRHTTNPRIATGDGIAMGFRAGARVGNMEFIQFHPTALYGSEVDGRAFLISEAVRGEGAILRTNDGTAFMEGYHPDGSLAPRDVVARAIDTELRQRGEEFVLLDATHLDPDRVVERFPNIRRTCLEFGIDITRQPIPVVPAAHYVCGGLAVNSWGETSVPGLFAAGECAFTGLHGANRLASNSLLEALVFADRAAQRAGRQEPPSGSGTGVPPRRFVAPDEPAAAAVRAELRGLMSECAGIVRNDAALERASGVLAGLAGRHAGLARTASVPCLETWNLLTAGRLIVECARRRPESRGLHFNQDHPSTDEALKHDTTLDPGDLRPAQPAG